MWPPLQHCFYYLILPQTPVFTSTRGTYLMKKYNFCVVFILSECCYSVTVAAKGGLQITAVQDRARICGRFGLAD
jgi:hypothetical protein